MWNGRSGNAARVQSSSRELSNLEDILLQTERDYYLPFHHIIRSQRAKKPAQSLQKEIEGVVDAVSACRKHQFKLQNLILSFRGAFHLWMETRWQTSLFRIFLNIELMNSRGTKKPISQGFHHQNCRQFFVFLTTLIINTHNGDVPSECSKFPSSFSSTFLTSAF